MKWCLSGNQSDEYIKKADEIKVMWANYNVKPDILQLVDLNPNARILIFPSLSFTLTENDYKWFCQQLIICQKNMAVIVSDDKQAQYCKDLNIPFFFAYPARTFQQVNRMRNQGATDIYIDDMLCHCLDSLKDFYGDLKIRVIANSCGWGTADEIWDGIEGAWFRPEDLWAIDQIYVAEFKTNLNNAIESRRQEQALYRIYAEKHAWAGPVDAYVFDIKKKNILNRLLDDEFQERRNNCRMKCMETHHCHYCITKTNMALKENAEKIKENINNDDI